VTLELTRLIRIEPNESLSKFERHAQFPPGNQEEGAHCRSQITNVGDKTNSSTIIEAFTLSIQSNNR
jgi:hypothetical protein